jgi:hypothetical protein
MPSGWERWNKDEYHPNFARRARWRKKRVKFSCEECGAKQGETRLSKSGQPYKVVVSAAHVNHDPANPRAKLIILCQVCHLEHDVFEHARKAKRTYHRKEREKKIQSGQLELPLKFKKDKRKRRKQ